MYSLKNTLQYLKLMENKVIEIVEDDVIKEVKLINYGKTYIMYTDEIGSLERADISVLLLSKDYIVKNKLYNCQ